MEIETLRYLGIFCSPPTLRGEPESRLGTSVTRTYLYALLPLNSQAYASAQMYPIFVEIYFLLLFLYYHLSNPSFTGATSNITLQVLYEIWVFWFNECYYNQAIFYCFQCSRDSILVKACVNLPRLNSSQLWSYFYGQRGKRISTFYISGLKDYQPIKKQYS